MWCEGCREDMLDYEGSNEYGIVLLSAAYKGVFYTEMLIARGQIMADRSTS